MSNLCRKVLKWDRLSLVVEQVGIMLLYEAGVLCVLVCNACCPRVDVHVGKTRAAALTAGCRPIWCTRRDSRRRNTVLSTTIITDSDLHLTCTDMPSTKPARIPAGAGSRPTSLACHVPETDE